MMDTTFASYNEASGNMIELIIANNDGMAMGAIEALKAKGYNDGTGKSIPVFGVDATDDAKTAIADGSMVASIGQDHIGMAAAIVLAVQNALAGKAPSEGIAGASGKSANGTVTFNADPNVANKIYIPYFSYAG
jgi:methyl-galactoside transport system substrate-binding protein